MPIATESAPLNSSTAQVGRRWTPAELRKLPVAERDAVLSAAAALAEAEYRHDPELTAFEAFGEDDLYGASSSSATR